MSGKRDLVRLRAIRRGDVLDDQKTAASITDATAASDTLEDFQSFLLSQVKRIIHGDDAGLWSDDFVAARIPSLVGTAKQLINFIDEGPVEGYVSGAYKEILGTPWPSDVTWYVNSTKAKKIVSKTIVRNADQAPTSIAWTLYKADGVTPLITATDTIVNTGTPAVFEFSRTRVIA